MKKMIAIVTKHTDGRLSTNPENGSFQNRPQVIIYDFKFGKTARMSKSQYYKYSSSFPDASIVIIKRQ